MRCPKCGYNSFDHLDSCKKCGKDLAEHKQKFGIVSVLFPGQTAPVDQAAAEDENVVADVVAAATATPAAASTEPAEAPGTANFAADDSASAGAGEGDDFGFDFMGDSEEEEDLSFDELFEEAPADEDVEETLPSPEQEAAADKDGDEFAFDLNGDEDSPAEAGGLDDDFGFDPTDDATGDAENLEADDFELPQTEEEDFSFDTDNVEFEDSAEEDTGTEGDPKSPFDLPESSQQEEAPEETFSLYAAEGETGSVAIEEDDLLLTETFGAAAEQEFEALPAEEPEILDEADPVTVMPAEPLLDEPFVSQESTPAEETADRLQSAQDPSAGEQAEEHTEPSSTFEPPTVVPLVADEPETVVDTGEPAPEVGSPVEPLEEGPAVSQEPVFEDAVPSAADEKNDAELLPATGNRVAAFCCDLLLLVVVGISFVIAAEAAISTSGDGILPSMETLIDLSVPYFLVLFSLAFGYFTLFHFLAGQTPGKMLAGLRVETVSGEPLLFSQAFLRSVGGLLQVLPVGLGYLVILSSADRRGWNDQLAGTRLISLRGLPEEV